MFDAEVMYTCRGLWKTGKTFLASKGIWRPGRFMCHLRFILMLTFYFFKALIIKAFEKKKMLYSTKTMVPFLGRITFVIMSMKTSICLTAEARFTMSSAKH